MTVPASPSATPTTGGTLIAGTYYYKVTALDGAGETAGSSEVSCAVDGATTTACQIDWTASTGAASYKIYGRATGAQDQYWTAATNTYTDTGTAGTAGTVPTTTTSYINKLASAGNSWVLGGNLGIGVVSPTAALHIKAGTAAANTASLKLTAGINLTAPEAGAIEFDGTSLYFTPSTTRKTIAFDDSIHSAVTLAGENYLSLSGQQITASAINLAGANVTGLLPLANGGTGTSTAFTPGSIVFAGASGVYNQDNSNFFWDNTNKRLGIGTATPQQALTLSSSSNFAAEMIAPINPVTIPYIGGTLAAGTYYYKVVASDGIGTTIGSSEVSCTVDGVTKTSCYIGWTASAGNASYRVYGRATGAQDQYWTATTNTYIDTGTAGTAGTVPTVITAYANKLTASGNSWLSGGNLGIGTASPQGKLHLYNGTLLVDTPASPTLTGVYNTSSGYAEGIYVSGKYAYVADYDYGLQIIDISNPASPTLTGTYNTSGNAWSVHVSGKYAYVADGAPGLQIIDISNPASPTLTGTYNTSGNPYDVYVSGKYAYVADYTSGLQIIDISNPASPTLAGTYNTSGYAWGVYVSGKYAYVADYDYGLQIINISNPASPTLTGTYNTPLNAKGIYVSGKYAYVADGSSLQIINISNPASPTLTGAYTTPTNAGDVYVSGKYAYVANSNSGLQIIDISNPASPTLAGTYNTSDNAGGVYVSGKYAYVADGDSLQIIDIKGADISSAKIGNIETNDLTAWENIDIGNNLYVRNGLNVGPGGIYSGGPLSILSSSASSSLGALDVKNSAGTSLLYVRDDGLVGIGTASPITQLHVPGKVPTSATGSVSTGTNTYPKSVYVQGRYAYVVNYGTGTLQVIDVSNSSSPILKGSVSTGSSSNPTSVHVLGKYAYVLNNWPSALKIFDVSNPASPTEIGTVYAGSWPHKLYVQGRYAYTVREDGGFDIFDVSNPASPISVGSTTLGTTYATSIYVQGKYAYMTDLSNKLSIYDVSNPSSPTSVGSVATGNQPYSVYVQGRYAYVVNYSANTLQVFDVSTPASPASVGSVATGASPWSVYVQGRYAYVTKMGTSDNLHIFDVSTPASPASVGTVSTNNDPDSVYVQGRYAYVATGASTLQIFDVGGSYIQQLEAGGIETATLQVRNNMTVNNDMDVRGGATFGRGINVTDRSAFYGDAYFGGLVGIGTVSPSGRLHSYISGSAVTASQYTGYFENLATNTTTDAINKYGAYITSTGAFTGSTGTATNNYGLYVNTPTGADNNYAAVFAGGNVGIGTTSPQQKLTLGSASNFAVEMTVPASPSATPTTGGTLTAGTYYYKVTARDGAGETTGSSEVSCTVDGSTTTACQINWTASTGAASYKIYGRATGAQDQYWTATTNTYTDTGTAGTAGTVPTTTTSYINKLAAGGNSWLLGGNLGIGTATPNNTIQVADLINFDNTDYNSLLGYQAGKNIVSGAQYNTFLGYQSGYSSSTASTDAADSNTGIGYRTFYSNTTGSANTVLGNWAFYFNTTGNYNSVIGSSALYSNTGGVSNIALGFTSLYYNTTGNYNVGLGNSAFFYNQTGSNNTAVGYYAGYGLSNNSNSNNSLFGYKTGFNLQTGSNNILLGYQAGDNLTTGASNIIIGYDIDAPLATSANTLNIGNLIFGTGIDGTGTTLSSGNIGIGVTAPGSKLTVAGSITLDNTTVVSGALADAPATGTCAGQANVASLAVFQTSTSVTSSHIFYNSTRSKHARITSVATCVDGSANTWQILTLTDSITGNIATDSYTVYNPAGDIGTTIAGFINNLYAINGKFVTATVSGGFDIAEEYQTSDESIEAGDIVSIDPSNPLFIAKSSASYDKKLLGIISTNPGLSLGNETIGIWRKVALSGRVATKVSLENGPIAIGDYLTSSSEPGVAMKATEPGRVIGMALESFGFENTPTQSPPYQGGEEEGVGKVMVFVNPHWSIGSLTEDGLIASSENNSEEQNEPKTILDQFTLAIKASLDKLGLALKDGVAQVKEFIAGKVTTKKLCIEGEDGEVVCVEKDQLKELLNKSNTQEAPSILPAPELTPTPIPEPIFEPTPTPESIPALSPEPAPIPEPTHEPTPAPTETPAPASAPAPISEPEQTPISELTPTE
ncbi:MAG: hypothetical protein WA063_01245 [Minisyncoccia bacterium]